MDIYKCLACESGTEKIYTSYWKFDIRGTLTCWNCHETEDARHGISKNGVRVENYKYNWPGGDLLKEIREKYNIK